MGEQPRCSYNATTVRHRCGRPVAAPTHDPKAEYVCGDVIAGRYQLQARIAEGGMGAVWRSLDLATGAMVALKVALRGDPHHDTAVRMQAEARLESELVHPGVVTPRSGRS
jgi:serine/threonine protein kinase